MGVLAKTHQCATESRMTLWPSANPVRTVGASPVILSPLANVFVSLSSVMAFCIVTLQFSKPIVTHVFCGMLEYLQPCSTISVGVRAQCRFQLSHSSAAFLAIFCIGITSHRRDSLDSVSALTWFSHSSYLSPTTPRPSWTCTCTCRGPLNLERAVECSSLRFRAFL